MALAAMPPQRAPGSASVLDGPPPSLAVDPGAAASAPQPDGLGGLAPPMAIPSGGIPPEILTGLMSAAETISSQLDAFAQVTPDLAAEWDLIKSLLQRVMGKVLLAGGTPGLPTAPGQNFPGGGFDRGQAGPLA